MDKKTDPRAYKKHVQSLARNSSVMKFSKKVEEESNKITSSISEKEIRKRKDFRNITTFTIDPDDAKDFDDALSVSFLENGFVEIGIHIADVSHYVLPKSKIDEEAYERGTSIYLPHEVISMLPEKLSNDICSLKEGVERLTFSVVFTFDKYYTQKDCWFGKTIIKSFRRFTYTDAQKIIDEQKGLFYHELNFLNKIAKKLQKERIDNGALILEDAELSFTYDNKGYPIGVQIKERLDTHKLVEEFMLLANKKVAELFNKNDSFVYRIHDKPDEEKVAEVKQRALEYKLEFPKKITNKNLNHFIESISNENQKTFFTRMIMRTMAKAIYSTKNIGHYGLAFKNYTHFTSPIRRYPDIIAHRLLEKKLLKEKNTQIQKFLESDLNYLSEKERFAQDIERSSQKDMQVLYMSTRLNEERPGYISGITEYGIYVSDKESQSEGMIYHRSLEKNWKFNTHKKFWKHKENNDKIKLGDTVVFKTVKVDIDRGLIDYILCAKK